MFNESSCISAVSIRHLSRLGFSTQHATTKMNVDVFNKLLAKIHSFTSSAWLPRHITAFREVLAPLPVASRYATCTCTTASGGCRGATSRRRSSPTGGEGCAPVMSVQSTNMCSSRSQICRAELPLRTCSGVKAAVPGRESIFGFVRHQLADDTASWATKSFSRCA